MLKNRYSLFNEFFIEGGNYYELQQKNLKKIREVIEKSLEQGKEVIPLYENKFNDTKQYCEIREFTAFVDKVQQSYRNEKNVRVDIDI